PVELAVEAALDAQSVSVAEPRGGNDPKGGSARGVLIELELKHAVEGVVVKVDGGPPDEGVGSGGEHPLDPVAPDISDERVVSLALRTVVADVGGVVTSPVADEGHHIVDEASADDLAPSTGSGHGNAVVVQQLEESVRRPHVVAVGMLALGRQHNLLGETV